MGRGILTVKKLKGRIRKYVNTYYIHLIELLKTRANVKTHHNQLQQFTCFCLMLNIKSKNTVFDRTGFYGRKSLLRN